MRVQLVVRLCAIALSSSLFVDCGSNTSSPPPNPVPNLTSLSPQTGSQFGLGLTLDVHGSSFIASSVIQVNSSSRLTNIVSGTEVSTALSPGDLAALGSLDITVVNPAPGGGVSNSISFDVVQPAPGVLRIVTLASDGTQTNADSVVASFSADGRFVAFDSLATNLVPNDTNGSADVFLRDTCLGVGAACTPSTTRVSVSTDGTEGNGSSNRPSISADGRYVAFFSMANNLVPNDTNFAGDIFVRDTCTGAPAGCSPSTIRVSLADDGSESNLDVALPLISSNGRFVVFTSQASNLVPNDTNGFPDVFIRDTCLGVSSGCTPSTSLVSVATDGSQANDTGSAGGAVSSDGRFVAFQSLASNLVPNDTNNTFDIFVRDTCFGAPPSCSPTTTRISVASDGNEGNDGSFVAAISQDGRFVSFTSLATNLVANDTNGKFDVFVRDTCFGVTGTCIPSTTRVSVASDGGESNDDSLESSVTANGRFVVFASVATNLVSSDTNGSDDVFVRDTCIGAAPGCTPSTQRVSIASDGTQGDANSFQSVISPDGRFVLLRSIATDLVPGDQNGLSDFFIAFN